MRGLMKGLADHLVFWVHLHVRTHERRKRERILGCNFYYTEYVDVRDNVI
jgi:hypothetical protein